jgi:hypothetical protein
MWIKDTPENRSLAAIVERNAKASTGLNLAKRAFWHGGGFALRVAGAGLGAGVMLAGLGYGVNQAGEGYDRVVGNAKRLHEQQDFQARMTQEQEQAEQKREKTFAALMSQEREEFFGKLAATTIHGTVTGNVGLLDGQHVTASGTVALPPDTTIHLDPNATVRAVGDTPDAPRAAPKLLRQASAPAPKACRIAQP